MNSEKNIQVADSQRTLEDWANYLKDKEMPIFSNTVQRLKQVMEDERSGVSELSCVILEDQSLTTKILKMSNTIFYNQNRQHIATITRAIALIGLKDICELAIACSFMETILSERNKRRVNKEIARALHAAIQAKSFAILMNAQPPLPEEAFISGLLHNIGHVAFRCFEEGVGDSIDLLTDKGMEPEKAERQVLGFTLKQLGLNLGRSWQLGKVILEVYSATPASKQGEIVKIACEVARYADQGWEAPEIKNCLVKLSKLVDKTEEQLLIQMKANAESAILLANRFGAREASAFIPNAHHVPPSVELPEKPEESLLAFIQDITDILGGDSTEFHLVFQMIVEGIYRGLDMDRVLLALLTPDRKLIREKSALGWPQPDTRGVLQIPVSTTPPHLLSYCVERNERLWAKNDPASPFFPLYTPSLRALLGYHECFISPISANKRVIGLFYADRAMRHHPMTQKHFEGFKQITQHANIALRLSMMPHG
ncbi:HDOD domain-containing protein [Gammaproteobacteria bacterium]